MNNTATVTPSNSKVLGRRKSSGGIQGTEMSSFLPTPEPTVGGTEMEDPSTKSEQTNRIEQVLKKYTEEFKSNKNSEDAMSTIKQCLQNKFIQKKPSFCLEKDQELNLCALDEKGTTLLTGGKDGYIYIFTREERGQEFSEQWGGSLSAGDKELKSLFISQDGLLAISAIDGKIMVWKREDKTGIFTSKSGFCNKINFNIHPISVALSQRKNINLLFCGMWDKDENLVIFSSRKDGDKYEHLQTLKGHTEKVNSVASSQDGSLLFSGSEDCTVKVWGQYCPEQEELLFGLIQTLNGHKNSIKAVSTTSEGDVVASGSDDHSIIVWTKNPPKKGKISFSELQVLNGHTSGVLALFISSQGRMIVSGAMDMCINIWIGVGESGPFRYTLNQRITSEGSKLNSLSVSADLHTIIELSDDKRLTIWERKPQSGDLIAPKYGELLKHHAKKVNSITTCTTSKKSDILFSGSKSATVGCWLKEKTQDFKNLKYKFYSDCENPNPSGEVNSISVSRDGEVMVSGTLDGAVLVWIKNDNEENKFSEQKPTLEKHSKSVNCVFITPDAKTIYSGSTDGTIHIYVRDKAEKYYSKTTKLRGRSSFIWDLAVTRSEKTDILVAVFEDSTIKIWQKDQDESFSSYKIHQILKGHTESVYKVDISPDGRTIVSGAHDYTVKVWVRSQKETSSPFILLQSLTDHTEKITSISLWKEGSLIISGSEDKSLRIWEKSGPSYKMTSKYKTSHTPHSHTLKDNTIFFSSDNQILLRPFCLKSSFFDSLISNYYYGSIFDLAFSKPSTNIALNYLLDNLPCFQEEGKITDRSELLELHHGVNPLYWFCFFQAPSLLREALERCEYEQWVYEECDAYDPFSYSLESKNEEMIDVWADYFLKEENAHKLIIRDIGLLQTLLNSKSGKVQSLGVSKFLGTSCVNPQIEPIKKFALNQVKGYTYTTTPNPFIDPETKKKLKSKGSPGEGIIPVKHQSTLMGLPTGLSRIQWLITSIENMTPENQKQMRPLVFTLYNQNYRSFVIYSLINLIGHICLFAIVVFRAQQWPVQLLFTVIYLSMLIFEFFNLCNQGLRSYFLSSISSIYNWFDIIVYPAGMIVVILVTNNGYDFLKNQL